ncbi:MAG: 2,3-bisphosphoglycerate-independent phosphoglycerate mutase, partial [Proteobacteria bacterium]|nr:2,3-bisphosphoglycerate-independent phosphoglycerate mutase [Pseudomonadota bacterium]
MKHPVRKKTLLVIIDGFGINPDERFNAIAQAKTPNFDNWLKNKPNTTLLASGRAVGLPEGQMGSSEVGHSILGSGVVVAQELVRISAAI